MAIFDRFCSNILNFSVKVFDAAFGSQNDEFLEKPQKVLHIVILEHVVLWTWRRSLSRRPTFEAGLMLKRDRSVLCRGQILDPRETQHAADELLRTCIRRTVRST